MERISNPTTLCVAAVMFLHAHCAAQVADGVSPETPRERALQAALTQTLGREALRYALV